MSERRTDEERAREVVLLLGPCVHCEDAECQACVLQRSRVASAFASLRAEIIEECAKVADAAPLADCGDYYHDPHCVREQVENIVDAIRSLSTPGSRP